jgi:hypothetical protein
VKQFRRSKFERSERQVGEEAERGPEREESDEDGSAAYRQVGEDVAEVLTAAERMAARIRENALQKAEQIRLEADESASATLAEAQARRAEADGYSDETRAAADAYAEERRRTTDEEAASRVSQAEEQARRIRAEAEQKARDLEAEAIQRRDTLARTTEDMEERIESMVTAFRGVTTDLEGLLPDERRRGTDEVNPEPPADDVLDDALKPAPSRDRLSSHADS